MSIPDEAVEAAGEIVAYRLSQIYPHERNPQHEARVLSRIALEAAAPYMTATRPGKLGVAREVEVV